MAYANYIAGVDWEAILRLREGIQRTLQPREVVVVSHLIAYWEKAQPLGSCLTQIIDGGLELSPVFWHPLRVPKVHSPDEVRSLGASLHSAWEELGPEAQAARDWREISEVIAVFDSAVSGGRAIVSVLEPPADEKRATRVTCPFDEPSQLPIPWGSLSIMIETMNF